jgi:Tir chaperone protein (CesT) family
MKLTRAMQLLDGLGEVWPELAAIDRVGEDTWLMALEDGTAMVAEWVDGPPRLVLSTPIGSPELDRRFVVYEAVLGLNALWRDTGGIRVALSEPDGEMIVMLDLLSGDVTAQELQQKLADWCAQTRAWRDYLAVPAQQIAMPDPVLFQMRI